MKKINVLQVIYQLGDGGVETMLMNIYRNIDHQKYKFIFLVQEPSIKFVDEINDFGGKVISIKSLKEIGIIKYISLLKKICIDENIDVVHAHNLTQNPIILFAAFLAGVKIRISHSHLTSCFSKKAEIAMPLIRLTNNMLSTEKFACGTDAGKFLYGSKKFTVINNAIDIDKFINPEDPNLDSISRKLKNKYIILHVGRLCEQKNHDYIIKIAKELKLKNDNFVILCCGSGPLENEIKEKIKQNKLEDNIILLGSRNDIPSLMKIANLFILPSLYEGLPVTIIEAQASQLKCLVSDTVDEKTDLGIGLVDFIPITNESINLWIEKILFYLDNGYKKNYDVNKILTDNGYNSKINSKVILKVYNKEKN